jgi:hypothetical protein
VNRSFLSLRAASRTRSSALGVPGDKDSPLRPRPEGLSAKSAMCGEIHNGEIRYFSLARAKRKAVYGLELISVSAASETDGPADASSGVGRFRDQGDQVEA